jgi:hypothetical protein
VSKHTVRWFVEALRDACNHALEDGMVGDQLGHIEDIEVTDNGSPIMLKVTCFGAYSPTESQRVYENLSVMDVGDLVGRYLTDRGFGLKTTLDDLKEPT